MKADDDFIRGGGDDDYGFDIKIDTTRNWSSSLTLKLFLGPSFRVKKTCADSSRNGRKMAEVELRWILRCLQRRRSTSGVRYDQNIVSAHRQHMRASTPRKLQSCGRHEAHNTSNSPQTSHLLTHPTDHLKVLVTSLPDRCLDEPGMCQGRLLCTAATDCIAATAAVLHAETTSPPLTPSHSTRLKNPTLSHLPCRPP